MQLCGINITYAMLALSFDLDFVNLLQKHNWISSILHFLSSLPFLLLLLIQSFSKSQEGSKDEIFFAFITSVDEFLNISKWKYRKHIFFFPFSEESHCACPCQTHWQYIRVFWMVAKVLRWCCYGNVVTNCPGRLPGQCQLFYISTLRYKNKSTKN